MTRPQRLTRQGKDGVVMIAEEQYDRLKARSRQPKRLVQFFRESPLVGVELDLEQDKDRGATVSYERIPAGYELHFRDCPAKAGAARSGRIDAADEAMLYLSFLTIGEIRKGVAGLAQGKRRTNLESWLEIELPTRFAGRIVPIDAAIADGWGLIDAEAKRKGKALSVIDGFQSSHATSAILPTRMSRS